MTAPDHMPEAFENSLHETGHPHMEPPANPGRFKDAFWHDLKLMAAAENRSLSALISSVDDSRQWGNLSSALRLFVLAHYQGMAGRAGQHLNVVEHEGQRMSAALMTAATR